MRRRGMLWYSVTMSSEPSTCKFFLNRSDKYESVTRKSDYRYLQKLDHLQQEARQEGADLVTLKLEQLVASEVAPFLGEFCGDFVAGVEQMAGLHQYVPKSASTKIRRQSRISPNMPSSPILSASTTTPPVPSMLSAGPSNTEKQASRLIDQRRIIARLANYIKERVSSGNLGWPCGNLRRLQEDILAGKLQSPLARLLVRIRIMGLVDLNCVIAPIDELEPHLNQRQ